MKPGQWRYTYCANDSPIGWPFFFFFMHAGNMLFIIIIGYTWCIIPEARERKKKWKGIYTTEVANPCQSPNIVSWHMLSLFTNVTIIIVGCMYISRSRGGNIWKTWTRHDGWLGMDGYLCITKREEREGRERKKIWHSRIHEYKTPSSFPIRLISFPFSIGYSFFSPAVSIRSFVRTYTTAYTATKAGLYHHWSIKFFFSIFESDLFEFADMSPRGNTGMFHLPRGQRKNNKP